MEYVKVPVPEDCLTEVLQYLQTMQITEWRLPGAGAQSWDLDATTRLLGELDEAARTLVIRTAEAVANRQVLSVHDASIEIGQSEHEVLGLTIALNDVIRRVGGPVFSLHATPVEGLEDRSVGLWPVSMTRETARFFLDADPVRRARRSW